MAFVARTRGSAVIVRLPLLQKDGTTVLAPSLVNAIKAEILQGGVVKHTYDREGEGVTQIRNTAADDGVDVELTAVVTTALSAGPVSVRLHITVVDTDFTASSNEHTWVKTVTPLVLL